MNILRWCNWLTEWTTLSFYLLLEIFHSRLVFALSRKEEVQCAGYTRYKLNKVLSTLSFDRDLDPSINQAILWFFSDNAFVFVNPFPNKPWFLRVCSTSVLKTLREKKKFARFEQFLLFPQYFPPVWRFFCHFHQIWNCRLQTLSVLKSLKLVIWERVKLFMRMINYKCSRFRYHVINRKVFSLSCKHTQISIHLSSWLHKEHFTMLRLKNFQTDCLNIDIPIYFEYIQHLDRRLLKILRVK